MSEKPVSASKTRPEYAPMGSWILRYSDPPDQAAIDRAHTKFAGKVYTEDGLYVSLIAGTMGQELVRRWNSFNSLLEACNKIVAWVDKLAELNERRARDTRFISLSEAYAYDARNYRATAADIRKTIESAEKQP